MVLGWDQTQAEAWEKNGGKRQPKTVAVESNKRKVRQCIYGTVRSIAHLSLRTRRRHGRSRRKERACDWAATVPYWSISTSSHHHMFLLLTGYTNGYSSLCDFDTTTQLQRQA